MPSAERVVALLLKLAAKGLPSTKTSKESARVERSRFLLSRGSSKLRVKVWPSGLSCVELSEGGVTSLLTVEELLMIWVKPLTALPEASCRGPSIAAGVS